MLRIDIKHEYYIMEKSLRKPSKKKQDPNYSKIKCTSKLQLVVPLMEYPHAWSSLPGKASPEIWSPSIAGSGSSSAAAA